MSFLSQRLFSLCSPAATFSQIQPSLIDYGDDTNDPDFSQSYYESTPGVIIKQKSRRRENSQRMKGTTDDEIHFFLQNVNVPIASAMDGDIFLRESYDNITKCYKYEGINRSSYKSSLVKVMVDVCTAKSLIDYGKSLKLQTLLTVVGQLTEVLSNFNEHAGEMMMSNNSHCLVSVEKALIASDIILTAMYALTIPSNSGNDPVEEPFLHSLNKLLMNLLSLGNSIYLNESSDLKFLWCNTLKREFSVILNILEQIDQDSGRSFSSSEAQAKPLVVTNKFLSDLILVVQTAGAGVSLTKTLCGDSMSLAYMYVINSMFWELCAKVLKVLQGQFKAPSSTALSRNKFPYSTLAKNKPKHVTTNVYAYITRVVNHLCMTIPTKYELFHEINKLMAGKSAIHTEYLPDEDNRFLSTLSGYIHEVASRQVTRRGSNNLRNGLANLVDIREMEESTDSVDSPLMPLQQDQLSFRVRYLLLGISYLFDCPGGVLKDGNESNMSLDFPDKSGWVSALTELLMMSISGNRKDYHGFSVDISCLSPFIAQLLLQISFHTDMKSSFDCIFWELAKSLQDFTEIMRKRGRAGNPHFSFGSDPTQQLYAHSSLVHSNPTLGVSANARQPSDAKSVGNIIEIKIDTPQLYRQATDQSSYSDVTTLVSRDHSRKQSDKNSTQKALFIAVDKSKTALSLMRDGKSPIDTEAAKSPVGVVSPLLTPCSSHNPTPEPSIPKFTVGERVDGLYTLQNGSERWFAGEVIKVNGDDTYALMFDDGEVKEAQPAARIRVSRQRKKTSLSNSATNSAEGTPSKSAPGAPNTNADSRVVENRAIDTTIALLSSPTATPHSPDKFFDLTPSSDLTAGEFSFSTPGRETMAERGMVPTLETIEDNSVADQTIYANRTEDSEADPLTKAIAALVNADSVESLDDSDEDSGDFVFEIPSVFDNGPRTNNLKCAVPAMEFIDVNTAGSAPYASAGSLSGALLSDNPVSPIATGRSGMDILHRTSSEDTSIHQSTKPAYSNGTVGQSGVRRSSKPGQIEINSSGGNPRHGSWRIEDTGRTSDRTTPTHSSSHHSGSQARHNVPPLNVLPNKNLFRGSGTARSAPYASARSFRSGYTDNQGLGSGIAEEAYDMEDQVFYPLLRTYTIVTAILLKRCIVDDTFLDQSCCVCSESVAAPRRPLDADGSLGIAASLEVEHANIVFSIREFLAASALYSNITVSIAELSKQSHPALGRLTKLLHGGYLSTCLPLHMDTGEKIGEGAFGTVFRITCPENCGAFKKFSNCYNCYAKQCNMVGEYCDEPCCDSLTAAIGRSARQFAVKRIPRERSVFDNPAIFHLFNEISALECMRGCIGVCSVEDYGVCGAEYWLIMESGSLNLSEWRLTPTDSTDSTREVGYTNFDDAVDVSKVATLSDLLVYLSVFLEVLMIVRSVHIADVAHFDIKSNNFVLRKDPRSSFKSMLEMHDKDQLSGVLFLADFGEAITNISKPRSRAAVVKSRGTVSIQSPEMLCINAADPLSSKPSSNINESIPIHSSSSVFSKVNTPSNAKSERKQFDLPDKTSDVWSLGCLLVEILTSETLFANRSWPELYVSLCMNNFRPVSLRYIRHAMDSFNRSLITKIETIARGALQQDPNDRSTIEDLIFDTKRVIHELLKNKVEENEQLSLQNKSGSSKDLYKKQESEYFDVQISNNNSPRSRAGSLFLGRRTHSSSALPAPMSIISSPRVTEEDARVLHSMDERTAPIHTRSFRVYEDMYFNLERNHHILEDYFESNGAMGRANDLTSHASLLSRVAVVDQTIKKADIDYAVADMSRKLMMRNRLNRRYAFVRIIPLCNSESSLEVPGQNKHREDDVEYISNGNFDYWVCTLRICEDYSILSGRLAKIVDRMVEHTLLENCIIIVSIEPIKQQTGGKDGSLSARKSSHHGTSSSQSNINSGSTSTNNCLKLPLPANSTEESYCYTKRSIAVALAITCALQSRLRHQRLSGSRPKTTEYYILAKFFGESYQALMLLVRSLPGLEVNVSHDLLRVYLQFYLSEVSE